ncbi:MAG TPA: biotin/lipoyl-containing protein, partial [Solirubrobacterales bacterium]|nr:biotin/lipoyl-containing protein [Solirubrobacterales bacterium]
MEEIVMPRLSDSMEEGTVLKWLKSVGDEVQVGEELVEIETDKANMVYESDLAGTIVEVLAQEGDTLPVGDPIARVGEASEVVDGGGGGGAAAGDRPPSTGEQGA